jgi:competence protein ComEC
MKPVGDGRKARDYTHGFKALANSSVSCKVYTFLLMVKRRRRKAFMSVEVSGEIPFRPPIFAYAGVVRDFAVREIILQKSRLFLWFPVFLSLGIALYFSLPAEPPMILGLAAFAFALAGLIVSAGEKRVFMLAVFLAASGFASAQLRTYSVYTPILEKEIGARLVHGRIEVIEGMEDGAGSRLLLSGVQIEKMTPEETPVRVRLSVRSDEGLQVGQRIRALAGLGPPSPPLQPGAFDFQRYMFFQRIGALGFAYKQPQVIGEPSVRQNFIERIRVAIDRRIEAHLPYPEAAVAMALTTGRRAAISEEANDAITAAGLAHILSISGLHIGIVSGIVFFLSRLLMVCIPGFGLRQPVKKYAAILAFMAAAFYTLLAGATIPTQRSLIMVGIALFAIIVDRSPLSIRLVAFAAFAVLLFAPESLMSASFQMSFAAVAGLVMVFDYLRPWMSAWHRQAGLTKRAALYLLSVSLTTVIATVATAPFTIFHFQQFQIYGVIANALAVPLSAFVIMPAAVLALVLMPFGLEQWPLVAMGAGVDAMIDISVWVAALPYALVKIPAPPPAALPCFMAGIMLLFLVKGVLRYAAVVPLIACILMIAAWRQPDIVVAPGFDLAGVRAEDGSLYVSSLRREKFVREKWESNYGLQEGSALAWPKEGQAGPLNCDEAACRAEINGKRVSFLKNPGVVEEECRWAALALSFNPVNKRDCGVPVIDKFTVLDEGAQAVWLGDAITIQNAEKIRGVRPWSSGNETFSGRSASGSRAGPGF